MEKPRASREEGHGMLQERASFTGLWQITEMETWDQRYLRMQGPPYLHLAPDNTGSLRCGLIEASVDYRISRRNNIARIEFTWEGRDEGEPICGRGEATLESKTTLRGKLYVHMGDESEFAAKKDTGTQTLEEPRSSLAF